MQFTAHRIRPSLTSLRAQTVTLTALLAAAMLGATTFVIYLDSVASANYLAAAQAQDTQLDLAALETAMNDARAGIAAFLATGNLVFLEPEVGIVDIRIVLETIRAESSGDDRADVARLAATVTAWRAWADSQQSRLIFGIVVPQPKTTLDGKGLFDLFLFADAVLPTSAISESAAALALSTGARAQAPAGRKVLGADRGHLAIVSQDGSVEWEMPYTASVHALQVLPNGNILTHSATKVVEISPEKKTVWRHE